MHPGIPRYSFNAYKLQECLLVFFFLFSVNCCHIFEITMLQIRSPSTKAAQRHAGVIKQIRLPLPHTIHATSSSTALNFLCRKTETSCVPSWVIWAYSSEHDRKPLQIVNSWTVKCNSLGMAISGTARGREDGPEERRHCWAPAAPQANPRLGTTAHMGFLHCQLFFCLSCSWE